LASDFGNIDFSKALAAIDYSTLAKIGYAAFNR
jgi:hypothetical protein